MEGLRDVAFDQDLLAAGLDSLRVMNLVRKLRSSFRDHDGGVLAKLTSPRTIYTNPTVLKLAASIQCLAEHGDTAAEGLERNGLGRWKGYLKSTRKVYYSPETIPLHANSKVSQSF